MYISVCLGFRRLFWREVNLVSNFAFRIYCVSLLITLENGGDKMYTKLILVVLLYGFNSSFLERLRELSNLPRLE